MAKKKTNYGPTGCVVVIVLLGAVFGGLYLVSEWFKSQGPSEERITGVTIGLVKAAVGDSQISGVSVTSIHSRRERLALSVERWAVQGQVLTRTETGETAAEGYIAVIEVLCDEFKTLRCWRMEQLSIGDETIRTQPRKEKEKEKD